MINTNEIRHTVPEFALKVGVGKTTAWQFVNQGLVGSIKLGKKIFVPESALTHFLNQCYRPAVNECDKSAILKTARRKNKQAQAG